MFYFVCLVAFFSSDKANTYLSLRIKDRLCLFSGIRDQTSVTLLARSGIIIINYYCFWYKNEIADEEIDFVTTLK